jgi:hypothetical protein
VIHGPHVASWFDVDRVAGLNLYVGYVVSRWANLVGADGADGVYGPSNSDNSKIFSLASAILNRQWFWMEFELAIYSAPRHDLFKLVSITFLHLQKTFFRGEDKRANQCWKLLEKIVSVQLREDWFVPCPEWSRCWPRNQSGLAVAGTRTGRGGWSLPPSEREE